jgi:hypothetical protein
MSQDNSINPIENPASELYFADYDPKEFKRPRGSNPLWDFFARSISLKVSICQIVSCGRVLCCYGGTSPCWRHLEASHREIYQTALMKQKEINIRRRSYLSLSGNKSFGSNKTLKRHQNAAPMCTWCGKRFTTKKPQYVISWHFRRLVFSIRSAPNYNCSF